MSNTSAPHPQQTVDADPDSETIDDGHGIGIVDVLTWLGSGKRLIGGCTAAAIVLALAVALSLTPIYTARSTLLPPGSQQQSGSAAALAALGSLGNLAGGLASKTPDELYVALLKSDSVTRALDERFGLKARYKVTTNEALRKALPGRVRVSSERKAGVITVEVDDADPKFAADLVNAHVAEVTKVLSRLAVSEAQQRRMFFEKQLSETKENLIKAETDMRRVQEQSGVIVLDKQAEALIAGAARVRALIAEREVELKVMRTGATDQNPEVMRLNSELRALRTELSRVESSRSDGGSTVDMSVNKIPEAAIDYVRARRELKLQETLLEAMVRQFELAKLDEAKEGPLLQQIDPAFPPDSKSKPSRGLIVLTSALAALVLSSTWVVLRQYRRTFRSNDLHGMAARDALKQAWRLRS